MYTTKIEQETQSYLRFLFNTFPAVAQIIQKIQEKGGTALVVGGAVRDLCMNRPIKDLDIEVYGLTLQELESMLASYGPVRLVGKTFGVLRIDTMAVDWSLPRCDSAGRKPIVHIDPFLAMKEAFERRDLTINAMGIELLSGAFIDPFGGLADLQEGILRSPNVALFVQDPLRFFRVMQFIARFNMKPDDALNACCATMDLQGISCERIETEFEKLMLHSESPSLGIRWIDDIGRLEQLLPELYALKHVPQETQWHPEGDVFEHSMQSLDAAARIDFQGKDRLILCFAALCHDLGKATTTKQCGGRWRSIGHEHAGVSIAKKLLERITTKKEIMDVVAVLVRHHMAPALFIKQQAKDAAFKRLAQKLSPHTTMRMLAALAKADNAGRNAKGPEPLAIDFPVIDAFIQKARQACVETAAEQPVVRGQDLLDCLPPGPLLGAAIRYAYELQINEGIQNKEELIRRVYKRFKCNKP